MRGSIPSPLVETDHLGTACGWPFGIEAWPASRVRHGMVQGVFEVLVGEHIVLRVGPYVVIHHASLQIEALTMTWDDVPYQRRLERQAPIDQTRAVPPNP